MSTQYANGQIVTNGLVFALDSGDYNGYSGTGRTWTDLTSNNYTGSFVSSASLVAYYPTFSVAQNALFFTGSAQLTGLGPAGYVDFGNPLSTLTTISIFAFIKSIVPNQYGIVIAKDDASAPTVRDWQLQISNTNQVAFTIWNQLGGNANFTSSVGGKTVDANWNQVGGTWDGTLAKAYLNGAQQSSGSLTGTSVHLSAAPIQVGAVSGSAGLFEQFNGYIASVQIYNRVLSASEIAQNYNAQKARFGLK